VLVCTLIPVCCINEVVQYKKRNAYRFSCNARSCFFISFAMSEHYESETLSSVLQDGRSRNVTVVSLDEYKLSPSRLHLLTFEDFVSASTHDNWLRLCLVLKLAFLERALLHTNRIVYFNLV
jgi:lipoate synthase